MKDAVRTRPLSEAQLMVLQVVKDKYNEHDLEELRELLVDFNSRKMQEHLDETIEKKGYLAPDFEDMLNGHLRKRAK